MVRTRSEEGRVEITSGPSLPYRILAVLFVAAAIAGGVWLLIGVTRRQTLHFTCDRPSESCALQVGDDVSLMRLSSLRAVTVVEDMVRPLGTERRLIVVLDDGTNRVIGRKSFHPQTAADYTRAAEEIRAFLAGNSSSIKVGYTVRGSLPEGWPAVALAAIGLLIGGWMLIGWRRLRTLVEGETVTWASSGPLRRARERRLPRAEAAGVARIGGGSRQRLELELANGKKLRLTGGARRGKQIDEAEAAVKKAVSRQLSPESKLPAVDDKARRPPA